MKFGGKLFQTKLLSHLSHKVCRVLPSSVLSRENDLSWSCCVSSRLRGTRLNRKVTFCILGPWFCPNISMRLKAVSNSNLEASWHISIGNSVICSDIWVKKIPKYRVFDKCHVELECFISSPVRCVGQICVLN